MKLQKASTYHVAIIQDLAHRSWQYAYSQILSPKQSDYMLKKMYNTPTIQAHLHNPNWNYFLLASEKNTFTGFIGYEHHHQPETTKLHRLYIAPEFMKRGYGKMAVEHVKESAKNVGNNRIILAVNKNNFRAQHFYAQQGFTIYDSSVFDIGRGFVMDDVLMEFIIE